MRSMEPGRGRPETSAEPRAESAAVGKATRADAGPASPSAFDGATWESAGEGQALPGGLRGQFEASLGEDLSGVRVHTGSASADAAAGMGAKAYATGQDIHFGAGQYDPASPAGRELLAHEVAHTVQQRGGHGAAQMKAESSSPGDAAEVEADGAAAAMVRGESTTIRAAPSAQRMLKSDRDVLLDSIRAAIAKQDWRDAALRMNGLSGDDITAQVTKLSFGQLAHLREGAVAAMPGWSQRVTDAIDAADGKAKNVADYYAQYEGALATAKASNGPWDRVADLLNGMGDWDIDDRLGRLDWFQLMGIKGAASARVAKAVDKADTKRVARAQAAYRAALAASDWQGVARQLNGFDDGGIEASLREIAAMPGGLSKLSYLRNEAVRIMPDHHERVTGPLDRIHAEKSAEPHDEEPETPYVASTEIPDLSDEARPLKGTPLEGFAGNAKIADFARSLAKVYAERKKSDPKVSADGRYAELEAGFTSTGKLAANWMENKLAAYARAWMSEMREHCDSSTTLAMKGAWHHLKPPGFDDGQLEDFVGGGSGGQKVHPIINQFAKKIGADAGVGTYPNHGGKDWAPFCIDVTPKIGRDDRGLYPRGPALAFIAKVDAIIAGLDGDWSSCYNDATFNAAANAQYGNRFAFAGQLGTGNWHGALKLHFHLYIVPKSGGPGSVRSAPVVDPSHE